MATVVTGHEDIGGLAALINVLKGNSEERVYDEYLARMMKHIKPYEKEINKEKVIGPGEISATPIPVSGEETNQALNYMFNARDKNISGKDVDSVARYMRALKGEKMFDYEQGPAKTQPLSDEEKQAITDRYRRIAEAEGANVPRQYKVDAETMFPDPRKYQRRLGGSGNPNIKVIYDQKGRMAVLRNGQIDWNNSNQDFTLVGAKPMNNIQFMQKVMDGNVDTTSEIYDISNEPGSQSRNKPPAQKEKTASVDLQKQVYEQEFKKLKDKKKAADSAKSILTKQGYTKFQ